MAALDDPRLLVLHGLRVSGIAGAGTIAEVSGLHLDRVAATLDDLLDEGLVTHREGAISGWSLTSAGREEHRRLVDEAVDVDGVRDDVRVAYSRFLELNPRLLAAVTRWQVREVDGAPIVNDHADAEHDASVLEELGSIHEGVAPILADLAAAVPRFGRYEPGLAAALAAVRTGDLDMVAKPLVPSYHTLWFELHEDLLATLSLERSDEEVQV